MPVDLLILGVAVSGLTCLYLLRAGVKRVGIAKSHLRFTEGLETARRVHGFEFEPRRVGWREAKGRRGDYHVFLDLQKFEERLHEPRHDDKVYASLRSDRLPVDIGFSPERGESADILTGDAVFDDSVEVAGDPVVLAALLDESLRLEIRNLVARNGCLHNGKLSWTTTMGLTGDVVSRLLVELAELAERLIEARNCDVPACLAANAAKDPIPGVRLWNLSLLQQRFPALPATKEVSRLSLADPEPWVRLAAARFLRDEGNAVLRSLVADEWTPDQASAEAASLLAVRLPIEESGPLLVAALKGRAGETRRQAIHYLGRLRYTPSLGPLCVLLAHAEARTGAAAAAALGALGDPKAEPYLVDALRREAAELRVAAARVLGRLGTVRAVEPLLHELDTKRLDGESRHAIREAVSAIQARLAGAEAGQLSMSATTAEAGRLSLATPRAGPGDVSLAREADRIPENARPTSSQE
jgi:hypothetical protein